MTSVNLASIDEREFEMLCDDLVGQKLSVEVKRGKRGPDGGIDGFFTWKGGFGVVQAKHYQGTGFAGLLGKLKNAELKRAQALEASRYILMTSCGLTPDNRIAIKELFGELIALEDIYSGDDICAALSVPSNNWIYKKHYKLWLGDVQALEQFCGDGNYSKSLALLEEIKEDLSGAVQTEYYERALSKLKQDGIIIIGGQAGTGKTMLAKQLVQDLVFNQGYQLVASDFDIGIFERELSRNPDRKLVFYLDDFLGSNILDALKDNRDARIVSFMRRIRTDDGRFKLIMTSRTYIVNDAKNQSVKFCDSKIADHVFELSGAGLGRIDRAIILHSHLVRGSVSDGYKNYIYENENYFKIVDHRNYNPRLISYCFDLSKSDLAEVNERTVMAHVLGLLDNPEQILRDCFLHMNQLELVIVVMVFLSKNCEEGRLRAAVQRVLSKDEFSGFRHCSVKDVLRNLCCSILSRTNKPTKQGRVVEYSLFNPSVGDYILGAYADNDQLLLNAALSLEDADTLVQVGQNSSWTKAAHPRYAKSCEKAFVDAVETLIRAPERFEAGFVLKFFNGWPDYLKEFAERKKPLAVAIGRADFCYSFNVTSDDVVQYLNWCREESVDEVLHDDRLTKDFLDQIESKIEKPERYLEVKAVYDDKEYALPEDYFSTFKERIDDWVTDLANAECYSGNETEDDIRNSIAETIESKLEDYGIPESELTADDCVDEYDFSPWAKSEEDGSSWQDYSNRLQLRRNEEDAEIRRIFSRG